MKDKYPMKEREDEMEIRARMDRNDRECEVWFMLSELLEGTPNFHKLEVKEVNRIRVNSDGLMESHYRVNVWVSRESKSEYNTKEFYIGPSYYVGISPRGDFMFSRPEMKEAG